MENIYFDGRKDLTLALKDYSNKRARIEVTEEHVAVLGEPYNKYLGHVVPTSGNSKDIANGILSILEEKNIVLDNLKTIGCDGTNVNVGWRSGVIRRIEETIKRPLHWSICQLHGNELPLRHLLTTLDGKTSGPNQFTGPIGKSLTQKRFGVNFQLFLSMLFIQTQLL